MDKKARAGFLSSLSPARIVGITVLGSVLVRNLSKPLSDPDLWWHLKTGELIVADRALPSVDPFSYTAAGEPWIVQEWLSEVFLHGLHRAFGLYGILFYRGMALFLLYLLVSRMIVRRAGGGMTTWVLVALTAFAGASNWTERPNLLSFLLFALTFRLIEQRTRAVWWFVPIAALWANLHGMVILGIGLVALVAVVEWLKVALSWEGNDRAWAKTLSLVGLAGIASSFFNPYGLGLHTHAFRLLGIVRELVTEWASPNFHAPGPILFLALLLVTIAVFALSRESVDPTDLALMLAFTFMALQAARNLAIAAIVIGVVCARYLPSVLARLPARERKDIGASTTLNAAGLVLAVSGLAIVLVAGFPRSDSVEVIADQEMYPVARIQQFATLPGVRMFAKDFWAPMVIFLDPTPQVFIDLRWDFYGSERAQQYRDTISGQAGWDRNLEEGCTNVVLIEKTDPLAEVLRLSPTWSPGPEDQLSVVFTRAVSSNECVAFHPF